MNFNFPLRSRVLLYYKPFSDRKQACTFSCWRNSALNPSITFSQTIYKKSFIICHVFNLLFVLIIYFVNKRFFIGLIQPFLCIEW